MSHKVNNFFPEPQQVCLPCRGVRKGEMRWMVVLYDSAISLNGYNSFFCIVSWRKKICFWNR